MEYNQGQSYLVIYDVTNQYRKDGIEDPSYFRKMDVTKLDPDTFMDKRIEGSGSFQDYKFVAYVEISESEYERLLDEDIEIK